MLSLVTDKIIGARNSQTSNFKTKNWARKFLPLLLTGKIVLKFIVVFYIAKHMIF
ncbi:hypothetical protein [Flavobacterium panacagri]|uniref:hypothetical protein n=1 Tax=Flavobacterium panacagri TaxID=3034146 RepID=UPI0025A4D962|nr:hypothetical protein [Flavobacterium panacagri]